MYVLNTKVDEYQEAAIKCNKNCLLIAGAGAGKTFTILGKINYLLENNIYKESDILVISFTNKSVDDLKRKINRNIDIFTFHRLAINILKDHNISFNIASDNLLEFITEEFFYSLDDDRLKNDILSFYKEYDYETFLKSFKFKNLINTISTYIHLFKTNDCPKKIIKSSFKLEPFLTKLIIIIMKLYKSELTSTGSMDFDDLIKEATLIVSSFYKYKYIIIDEFQDTSLLRWNLVEKLLKENKAKIFAVGDDFQSIYHFSGCNVNLFLDFKKIVPDSIILKLKYTYRNSQELIDYAGKFILKNPKQVNKELLSNKHIHKPIKYVYYLDKRLSFERLINKVLKKYDDVLVLERNNRDIYDYINHNFIKEKDFLIYKDKKIRLLTVHSSKGLEADCVIVINLIDSYMGFPNKIINNKIIDKVNALNDSFLYAEERRLFYVALTRTKNEIFLLTPFRKKSTFVKELRKITS